MTRGRTVPGPASTNRAPGPHRGISRGSSNIPRLDFKRTAATGVEMLHRIPVAWVLWGLVLLGLLLRFHAAGEWNAGRPDSPQRLVGDEPGYNNLALALLDGRFFEWEGRVPLYPTWLAGVHWLTGRSYIAIPYVQSLLGVAVIPLTYLLGRRLVGQRSAMLAAFLSAISYSLIHEAMLLQSEILFTPVLLVTAIMLVDAWQHPQLRRFVWLGCWVGISNLVRPTFLLLPPVLLLAFVWRFGRRGLRYGAVAGGVTMLVLTPWLVFGYLRHHAIYPLATSNAFLWQGSPEYYHLLHDEGYTYDQIWRGVIFAPGQEEHWPHLIEGDRYWTKRALRSIASEPLVYLRFAIEKTGTYWVGDPLADWGGSAPFDYHSLRRLGYTERDALQIMVMRFLPILAFAAAAAMWRNWRTLIPIYLLLAYATLLHAATHAEARLSEPFQPLLLLLIAAMAVRVGDHLMRLWLPAYADRG